MKFDGTPASVFHRSIAALLALILGGVSAWAGDLKFEAQLIWATTNSISPKTNHVPVSADVRKKLECLPLKWPNYFEVKRAAFSAAKDAPQKVPIDNCSIVVTAHDTNRVEVTLFDKGGKEVTKQSQSLPIGCILVLGGNAPGENGWLVALKRTE